MKKWIRNIVILLFPIFLMIIVNESTRKQQQKVNHKIYGVSSINSRLKYPNRCSWNCYHDTSYCKANHVKSSPFIFQLFDPLYFGIINSLHSTGYYVSANILVLVLFFPILIYFLLIKSLDLHQQIKTLKNG